PAPPTPEPNTPPGAVIPLIKNNNPPAEVKPPAPSMAAPFSPDKSVPPLGASVSPPPLGAASLTPSNSGVPKVKSFNVESYLCKPEDTSFNVISQRVFNSEKYARAILQFNREHPMASKGLLQ